MGDALDTPSVAPRPDVGLDGPKDAGESLAGRPIVVIGTSAWSQPWLTEQNLAYALSDRHPVLYVEPPGITLKRRGGDGRPRLRVEHGRGGPIVIYRPCVPPFRAHPLSARAAAPLLRAQIRGVARRLGLRPVAMVSGDARPGVVGGAGEQISVYIVKDWVYEDAGLLGRSSKQLRQERDAICAEVDLVLAISPELQRSLRHVGVSAGLLRHGFHADLAAAYERPAPREYADLSRPVVAFAGRIDGRLDVRAVRAVAARIPGATVVLIGPVSPRMPAGELQILRDVPSLIMLGERPRDALPPYLVHADCLIIPYSESPWSRHGSPLKLWDYLYAGPPVVGSGYSILQSFRQLVRFAETSESFVAEVAAALEEPGDRARRRSFALQNTWERRARELESLLAAALADRPAGAHA